MRSNKFGSGTSDGRYRVPIGVYPKKRCGIALEWINDAAFDKVSGSERNLKKTSM